MKCIKYLGYVIDSDGVHVVPKKIWVIEYLPSLRNLTELCSFLGLANMWIANNE